MIYNMNLFSIEFHVEFKPRGFILLLLFRDMIYIYVRNKNMLCSALWCECLITHVSARTFEGGKTFPTLYNVLM